MAKQREDALVAYFRAREHETHCRAQADEVFGRVRRAADLYAAGDLRCNSRGGFHGPRDDAPFNLPGHDDASGALREWKAAAQAADEARERATRLGVAFPIQ